MSKVSGLQINIILLQKAFIEVTEKQWLLQEM